MQTAFDTASAVTRPLRRPGGGFAGGSDRAPARSRSGPIRSKICARCSACACRSSPAKAAPAFAAAGHAARSRCRPLRRVLRSPDGAGHRARRGHRGEVVATYRVLTPDAARSCRRLLRRDRVSISRCSRPGARAWPSSAASASIPPGAPAATILALWSALGEFMMLHGIDVAFGCASVAMNDGGHAAASLWRQLAGEHLAPAERRVRPRQPVALETLRDDLNVETPSLIRGYLRCWRRAAPGRRVRSGFRQPLTCRCWMTLDGLPRRHRRPLPRPDRRLTERGRP